MAKIALKDNSISHNLSLSFSQVPSFFEWSKIADSGYVFVTDNFLNDAYSGDNLIAWLVEPMEVSPKPYEYVFNNKNKYKFILTHNMDYVDGDKVLFYPFGGCWIDAADCSVHAKNKLLSFISSGKKQTSGHLFRHKIIESGRFNFDLYGRSYKNMPYKLEALKDYAFQIVVENTKQNDFFTEKIIDCFQTGTIPIYWGSDSVNKYFNMDGIITFQTVEELNEIIKTLSFEFYHSKINAVKENFILSKPYKIPEDWLYLNYKHLFNEF